MRICSRRRLQGTRLRSRGGRSRRSKRKISLPTSHATSGDGECGTWQTVGGTHRWEAAQRAGWTAARKSRDGVGPWCAVPGLGVRVCCPGLVGKCWPGGADATPTDGGVLAPVAYSRFMHILRSCGGRGMHPLLVAFPIHLIKGPYIHAYIYAYIYVCMSRAHMHGLARIPRQRFMHVIRN